MDKRKDFSARLIGCDWKHASYPMRPPASLIGSFLELAVTWVLLNVAKLLANQANDIAVYAALVVVLLSTCFWFVRICQYLIKTMENK